MNDMTFCYEPANIDCKQQSNIIFKTQQDLMSELNCIIEKEIEYILRNEVVPPIRGKITKGKCRWRGITLIMDHQSAFNNISWDFNDSMGSEYTFKVTHPCKGVKQRDTIIPFRNITGKLNYGVGN